MVRKWVSGGILGAGGRMVKVAARGRYNSGMPEEAPSAKKVFTYDEAARLLPEVRRLTEEAYAAVESLSEGGTPTDAVQEQIEAIISRWAAAVMGLGIDVKGLWLVDFDNGSGYYCWRYPEERLEFYHSYEEGFGGRMRIQ